MMQLSIPDPRLREAVLKCDRWIDPLREVMFDVIVADSHKDANWMSVVDMVERARRWLSVALETTKTIEMGEYAMVGSLLDQLAEKARSRDRKGWEEVVEKVVPSLIDMVFSKYAICIYTYKPVEATTTT
jgi:hypothetical protein